MDYIKASEIHLGIPVEDFEGPIDWYVKVLGCKLVWKKGNCTINSEGNIAGIWGAMSDVDDKFEGWKNEGKYLAGCEVVDDAIAPIEIITEHCHYIFLSKKSRYIDIKLMEVSFEQFTSMRHLKE